MNINIGTIRKEYMQGGLRKSRLPDNPLVLFESWLQEAVEAGANEPTAVLLATVSSEGHPSTRTVLLKELREGAFVFYTNYESRKGRQLAANPYVSLSFVWHELERQVHVEGKAVRLPSAVSDRYFNIRPYKSRIAACISPQSQVIGSRLELITRFIRQAVRPHGEELDRPDNWGGYAVTPTRIEFWQGRENRLHDRLLYTLQPDAHWQIKRLAP